MSRPQKVALQRCFLFGNAPRGVEDAAPYKRKMMFFDTLTKMPSPFGTSFLFSPLTGGRTCGISYLDDFLII